MAKKNPLTNSDYCYTKGYYQCISIQVYKDLTRFYQVLIDMPEKSERIFCRHLIVVLWNYEVLCAVRKLHGLPPPEPLRLPRWYLARLADYMSSKRFSAEAYLELFQAAVIHGFRWKEFVRPTKQKEGQVRTLIETGFVPEVKRLAEIEAKRIYAQTDYVWRDLVLVASGKSLTKKNIVQFIKSENQKAITSCRKRLGKLRAKAIKQKTSDPALNTKILTLVIQLRMLKYHNCPKQYGIVSRWVRKNKQDFIDMFEQLRHEYFTNRKNCTNANKKHKNVTQKKDANRKNSNDAGVNYFFETTDGFYNILLPFVCAGYQVGGKSARLKPIMHPHLTNCPRRLRKSLFKGCYSADLACIQLAIMASFFNQTGLNNLLAAHKAQRIKIWKWLEQQLPANIVSKVDPDELKSAIKAAVYVVVFGGGEKTILNEAFVKNLPTVCRKAKNQPAVGHKVKNQPKLRHKDRVKLKNTFLKIPEIASLWQARDKFLDARAIQIMLATPKEKRTGNPKSDYRIAKKAARSELACIAQGFEQRAMGAIYREATQERQKNRPRFHILLNLFDGVVFSVNDPKSLSGIKKRLAIAIDKILDNINQNPLSKISKSSQYNSTSVFKVNSFLEIEPI